MLGLIVIFAFIAYLLIFTWVTKLVISWAKRNQRNPRLWGILAAFFMYNLVFWDWIPTLLVHKYYCATEAGFWVYKTPEQWKVENPGIAETLSRHHLPEQFRVEKHDPWDPKNTRYYNLPDGSWLIARYDKKNDLMYVDLKMPDGRTGFWLSERFAKIGLNNKGKSGLSIGNITMTDEGLIDLKSQELLTRYKDFSMGYGNMMTNPDWKAMKFWMSKSQCNTEKNVLRFYELENKYSHTGDKQ